MQSNSIFDGIMTKIKAMPVSEWTSPTGRQLWRLASKHTPPALQKMFIQGAQEKGLFPKPTRCDDNGDPLYSLEEIANFFGMTQEEGRKAYEELIAEDPDMVDGIHQGAVHVIH